MINEVDKALAELLISKLKEMGSDIITDAAEITYQSPATVKSEDGARLNLYLHDISENLELRDNTFKVGRPNLETAMKGRGPVTFNLNYIITAHANGNNATEHRLLSEVLMLLLRAQADLPDSFKDELAAKSIRFISFEIAQPEHPAHSDQSNIWQAMGGMLQPSIGLSVTASFNPYESKQVRVVREALFGYGQMDENGLKRPLDIVSVRACVPGIVSDEKEKPLKESFVHLIGTERRIPTDENGFFCFFDVSEKEVNLSISKEGFITREVRAPVSPMGRSDLFNPTLVKLKAVSVEQGIKEELGRHSAQNADFYDEARSVSYQLVGQLKKSDGSPAQYVLVRLGDKTSITDASGYYHFTLSKLEAKHEDLVALVPGKDSIQEIKVKNPQGETVLK